MLLKSTKNRPAEIQPFARELDWKKDFWKGSFDLKGPKLNILIRDKISFMGVAHLTRGGKILLVGLYRSPLCTKMGS